MYIYSFTGKLEPENLITSLDITSTIKLHQPDFGIKGTLDIKVKRFNLEVIYKSKVNHSLKVSSSLETLKNFIQETVELVINLYNYVNSIALDVYILSVKCPELNIDFRFGIKGEYNINKSENQIKEEFNKLFSIFTKINNSSLKDIFSDFRRAIKYPAMTAQFCFRAIETIRTNYFEDKTNTSIEQRRKNGWDSLRRELGYTKEDFKQIEYFGVPNRHGVYPTITYPLREQIMNFTRELIDKFIKIKLGIT